MIAQTVMHSPRAVVEVAGAAGMGAELRTALAELERRLARGALTVAGRLGPNAALCARFRELGLREVEAEAFRAGTRGVVAPPAGLPRSWKERWRQAGYDLIDLSLPSLRRAQTALALLAAEGCRPVVAGMKGSAGVVALAGDFPAAGLAEDADDAARLAFSPSFGVVAPPDYPPRRARLAAEALRQRHRDSRVTFLETASPETLERERSLEALSRRADLVVVLGEAEDAPAAALVETTRRLGLPAVAVDSADSPGLARAAGFRRIALTAGGFVPDEEIFVAKRRLEGEM